MPRTNHHRVIDPIGGKKTERILISVSQAGLAAADLLAEFWECSRSEAIRRSVHGTLDNLPLEKASDDG